MISLKNQIVKPSASNCKIGKTAPSVRYAAVEKDKESEHTSTQKGN